MKNIYLLLILALFVFISCQNQEKTAQRNIKEFLIKETGEKYQLQQEEKNMRCYVFLKRKINI